MSLTGSYVDSSEAETYFEDDPRAEDFLEDDKLEWYLKRATKIIDNLPLRGTTYYEFTTKATPGADEQNRQFPRVIDRVAYGWDDDSSLPEVPQDVLDAVCEEALAIYLFMADTDRTERKTMREDGVKSYSLGGDYAENFDKSISDKHKGLLSADAYNLMKGYIAGAVEVVF